MRTRSNTSLNRSWLTNSNGCLISNPSRSRSRPTRTICQAVTSSNATRLRRERTDGLELAARRVDCRGRNAVAVASALLGNFLVLRRLSMLGDAVSHAILPGLAVAFFISNSRSSLPMFIGAVVVGVLTALFTEWIRGVGKVDEGASMGVVFTSLFAIGLIMIVQAADRVDLDAGCVLYGAIELTPLDRVWLFGFQIPRAVVVLAGVTILNSLFVLVFFKELKLCSFDPALATSMGFSAGLMHYALMVLVAITAVASFESVGNILVVAMFIVPPATAYLLTDRLGLMIGLSTGIAAIGAITGHIAAVEMPDLVRIPEHDHGRNDGRDGGFIFCGRVVVRTPARRRGEACSPPNFGNEHFSRRHRRVVVSPSRAGGSTDQRRSNVCN